MYTTYPRATVPQAAPCICQIGFSQIRGPQRTFVHNSSRISVPTKHQTLPNHLSRRARLVCNATSVAGNTPSPFNIAIILGGIIALFLGIFWQNVQKEVESVMDAKEYRAALARTRQAVFVNKAVAFMNAGNPTRAVVELKLALQENAIVREPLITNRLEKQDMLGLYRLFVLNSEVPTSFPTLLQMREMFNLGTTEAERLEREVTATRIFTI